MGTVIWVVFMIYGLWFMVVLKLGLVIKKTVFYLRKGHRHFLHHSSFHHVTKKFERFSLFWWRSRISENFTSRQSLKSSPFYCHVIILFICINTLAFGSIWYLFSGNFLPLFPLCLLILQPEVKNVLWRPL